MNGLSIFQIKVSNKYTGDDFDEDLADAKDDLDRYLLMHRLYEDERTTLASIEIGPELSRDHCKAFRAGRGLAQFNIGLRAANIGRCGANDRLRFEGDGFDEIEPVD